MADEVKDCTSCSHALFSELLGEYKCDILQVTCNEKDTNACDKYKKGKELRISKGIENNV